MEPQVDIGDADAEVSASDQGSPTGNMRQVEVTPPLSAVVDEESERERLERLGRERPPQFQSMWAEVLFVYSILASQFMAASAPPLRCLQACIAYCVSRNTSSPAST